MSRLALWALLICLANVGLAIGKALTSRESPAFNLIMAVSFALMGIGCLIAARKEKQ